MRGWELVTHGKAPRRTSRGAHRIILACLAGSAIHGCGPQVELLRRDPGFNYSTLSVGGIAVFGVTTSVGDRGDRDLKREQFTALLESSLMKEREDLKVLPMSQLLSDLGMDLYESTLDRFEHTGGLDRTTLALLDSLAGDQVRYVLLGRIEEESITHDETVTDTPTESDPDATTTKLTTRLTVRIAFQVYDLRSAMSVWSATLTQSKGDSETYTDEAPGSFLAGLVGSLLGAIFGSSDEKEEYPPAPDATKVLLSIYSAVAEKLPERGH